MEMPSAVSAVHQRVRSAPGITSVAVAGSRRTGNPTALSDWDFHVAVEDAMDLDDFLDQVARVPALAVFWDPLSARANLIVLVDGPIKVDLIISGRANPHPIDRWRVNTESLPRIDAHFWDWILWLGSKQLHGKSGLVHEELGKMSRCLLRPMGVAQDVDGLAEAVDVYMAARELQERELDVQVDRRLERQVRTALNRAGVLKNP
jgi:hypothetical protein